MFIEKKLIVFDDMIADTFCNEKLNPLVTELFIRGRKLNATLVFLNQSYFSLPKIIRLKSTNIFIKKIPNKRELQHFSFYHSSNTDFMKNVLESHFIF